MKSTLILLSDVVSSLFITNTTISFKMKYPNLADVLDTAAPGVDHSKILSYGCQCQFLDGRPLAAAGSGHPVDEIDSACKQYRECQTCAQMDDGADCNVENVDWMYRIDLGVPQLDCLDPVKNCARHLCECDRQFALAIADAYKFYDERYSHPNFDQSQCNAPVDGKRSKPASPMDIIAPPGEIVKSEARCCGPTSGPRRLYNINKNECCQPKRKEYYLLPVGQCSAEHVMQD